MRAIFNNSSFLKIYIALKKFNDAFAFVNTETGDGLAGFDDAIFTELEEHADNICIDLDDPIWQARIFFPPLTRDGICSEGGYNKFKYQVYRAKALDAYNAAIDGDLAGELDSIKATPNGLLDQDVTAKFDFRKLAGHYFTLAHNTHSHYISRVEERRSMDDHTPSTSYFEIMGRILDMRPEEAFQTFAVRSRITIFENALSNMNAAIESSSIIFAPNPDTSEARINALRNCIKYLSCCAAQYSLEVLSSTANSLAETLKKMIDSEGNEQEHLVSIGEQINLVKQQSETLRVSIEELIEQELAAANPPRAMEGVGFEP